MDVHVTLVGVRSQRARSTIDVRTLRPPQAQLLLSFLADDRDRPVPHTELAELLWDGTPPPTWDVALRGLVRRTRAFLVEQGLPNVLVAASGAYQLRLPPGATVDIEEAERDLGAAEAALGRGAVTAAVGHAVAARAVFARPLLHNMPGAWAKGRRARHRDRHAAALEVLSAGLALLGRHEQAIAAARQAWQLMPLRESALRAVMLAYRGAGRRSDALDAYHHGAHALRRAMGTGPSPETERLLLTMLRDEHERLGIRTPRSHTEPADEIGTVRAKLSGGLPTSDPAARIRLLLQLGRLARGHGDAEEAAAAFEEAAVLARIHHDPASLRAAAIGCGAYDRLSPRPPGTGLALVEEALETVPPGDPERAVLVARRVQYFTAAYLPQAAVRAYGELNGAAEAGDPVDRAWALAARLQVNRDPRRCPDRLADAGQLAALAGEMGNTELVLFALEEMAAALAQSGDLDGTQATMAEYARLAADTRVGWAEFTAMRQRAMRAAAQGRFAECEHAAVEMSRVGPRVGSPALVAGARALVLIAPRWLTGRSAELLPPLTEMRGWMDRPEVAAVLAFLHAEAGDRRRAAAALRSAEPCVGADPVGPGWSLAVTSLTLCAVRLQDTGLCKVLGDALHGLEDRCVVADAGLYLGSFHFYLGRVAEALGHWEEAVMHHSAALERHRANRAIPWSALSGAALATALEGRGAPGDATRAAELAAEARREAASIGMVEPGSLLPTLR